MKLTRLRVTGFRSLRALDLRPRALCVLVDSEETATRDFAALLALLRALSEGRLQAYLRDSGVLAGPEATQPVRLELSFFDDHYGVELQPQPGGEWHVTRESVDLNVGLSALLVDPALDAPCAEASLPELAPREPSWSTPKGATQDEKESWYVGNVLESWLWWLRCFLRGIQLDDAAPLEALTLRFFVEPSRDPPPNAIWEQAQVAHSASRLSQVVLCTPSESLAETFDLRDVIRVDTREGVAHFTPLAVPEDT
ncbi:hypothetical protein HUA78_20745 [Myxococcus sp. CA033]|uniref:hypothetical protein n=1 Tax=Myxococcus sp. CA033 TaxID=2741516 RepID=UPI00157B9EA0|nr:hypothetical protein [Myxococcus sp. CA033]NTX36878.1 hypothetical protein [Myxococcus sp. CA033]